MDRDGSQSDTEVNGECKKAADGVSRRERDCGQNTPKSFFEPDCVLTEVDE